MTELIKNKRAIFSKNGQRSFLKQILEKENISYTSFADKIDVHPRTFNDWLRGEYSIPFHVLKKISKIAKVKTPKNIEIKEEYWYVHKGAKLGWKAVLKKYGKIGGDSEYRKKKWYEWWEKEGKYKKDAIVGIIKPIRKPRFSKKLAEFTGIMIGDGGITNSQISIAMNSETDREYGTFLKKMIKELFNVSASTFYYKDHLCMKILISRIELVEFCRDKLGLKVGNKLKQGLDIPDWIKKNIEFQKACLRGLIDTDGCIFNERHKINGRIYSYKRLNFSSMSFNLRQSVFSIFENIGMSPKIRNNRCVQIEKREEIIKYFKIIGTNNPKHKKRFNGGVR